MKRYLPRKAWESMSPGQRAATNKKKLEGSKKGRQFVPNTETAQKARAGAEKTSAMKVALAKFKDPEGGLTAAGRKHYERTGESKDLKPGVKKPESEMSVQDMKRKGSWARRFYAQKPLPPLKKPNGEPTRLALTAKAWGEPVPSTEQEARAIAAKGNRILAKAEARDKKAGVERHVFTPFAKAVESKLDEDAEAMKDPRLGQPAQRSTKVKSGPDEKNRRQEYGRQPIDTPIPT